MLWFEYGDSNSEGVAVRDTELTFIRENMPSALSYYHDDDGGFPVIVWDTRAGVIEAYVFDDGRATTWYFSPKKTTEDAWWRGISTVGENTAVAARWILNRIKRYEVKEESARLVNDFILCLEEMRGCEKGSPVWEYARSDARDSLTELCDLAGVSAEEVIGSDI